MDADAALDLIENRVAGVERRVNDRVEADDHVLPFVDVAKLHQLAPDLQRDGGVRLDATRAAAIRAGLRQRPLQRLPHALARHLDETELRDLQDLRLRSILLDLVLER